MTILTTDPTYSNQFNSEQLSLVVEETLVHMYMAKFLEWDMLGRAILSLLNIERNFINYSRVSKSIWDPFNSKVGIITNPHDHNAH